MENQNNENKKLNKIRGDEINITAVANAVVGMLAMYGAYKLFKGDSCESPEVTDIVNSISE